jgi:hypothetical protein
MQDVLDFSFSSAYEAEHALEKANDVEDHQGEVVRINLNQGMQEPDEDGPFWAVFSADGEWAVSRAGEWVNVA